MILFSHLARVNAEYSVDESELPAKTMDITWPRGDTEFILKCLICEIIKFQYFLQSLPRSLMLIYFSSVALPCSDVQGDKSFMFERNHACLHFYSSADFANN